MTNSIPPIRALVLKSLKNFPWAYKTQGEAIAAFADHLLAARIKSWVSLERLGLDELTVRQVQHAFLWARYHLRWLQESLRKRFMKVDLRETVGIALDDTTSRRFGPQVFGAAHQYDHCTSGTQYQNVVVDCLVTAPSYLDVVYEVYLPRKFLEREVGHAKGLITKIDIALTLYQQQTATLVAQGWRPDQIWWTSDAWYLCKKLVMAARASGVFFMMGTRGSMSCWLFGQSRPLAALFPSQLRWRYRTNPVTHKRVYYQMKKLYLPDYGWCRVIAVRRGKRGDVKYYLTNKLDVTIDTFLKRWKTHWEVETLHHQLKKFMGSHDCFSGREVINLAFWDLVYLLWYLFRQYQRHFQRNGSDYTFQQLWEAYCLDYDIERAKKQFRTAKQIRRTRRRFMKHGC